VVECVGVMGACPRITMASPCYHPDITGKSGHKETARKCFCLRAKGLWLSVCGGWSV
jgi:hypothetical protein